MASELARVELAEQLGESKKRIDEWSSAGLVGQMRDADTATRIIETEVLVAC